MKKLLSLSLIIFFSLLSANLFAQKTSVIDSLLNVLKTAKEDTNKVNTLNALCGQFRSKSDFKMAMLYTDSALALSDKLNFKKGNANAYHNIARLYEMKGNYSEALKNNNIALKIREEIRDKQGIAKSYGNIGTIYGKQGNYPEALKNTLASLKIHQESRNKQGIAICYSTLANIYSGQGNYSEALKNFFASQKIYEELGDKRSIAYLYNNIGKIYYEQGNYPEALKNYLATLKIMEEVGDKVGIAVSYGNIAGIYDSQRNFPEALKNNLASLKIMEEIGDKNGIAKSYKSIGNNYSKQGNYPEALKHCFTALKIMEEIGDKSGNADCYIVIGSIYHKQGDYPEALKNYFASLKIMEEIGDKYGIVRSCIPIGDILSIQGDSEAAPETKLKYDEAEQYLNRGLLLAKEMGLKDFIKKAYGALTDLDSAQGNFASALAHHKLYTLYKDSMLNEESNKQTSQLKIQYETEKKDKEIEIRTLEIKQKEALLLASRFEAEKKQNEIVILNTSNEVRELQLTEAERKIAQQLAESKARAAEMEVISKDKQLKEQQLEKQKLLRNGMFIGLLLVVVAGVFIFRSLQLRRKLEKQQAISHERKRISADLHDDVGSTLSSIRIMSTVAENNPQQSAEMVKKISENSKRMLENMGDIVWTENPDHDSFSEMLARMNQYAGQTLEPKGIRFKITAAEGTGDIQLATEHRRNFYLIFKEAVNNLAKYSECSEADIIISGNSKNLSMKITDNGKGFDASPPTPLQRRGEMEGNGLKNMRRRAENIHGDLKISSDAGKGTTIELQIPVA